MAIGTTARGLLLVLALAAAPGSVVGFGFQQLQQRFKPVAPGGGGRGGRGPSPVALGSAASSSTDLQGLSGT